MHRPNCSRNQTQRNCTFVNHHLFQPSLLVGSLYDALVNGVGRHQPIHHHRLGLTDAVAAILGLEVSLRVLGGGGGENRGECRSTTVQVLVNTCTSIS